MTSVPDKNELAILCYAFVNQFWPSCPFLDDIPLEKFVFSKSHLALAMAVVGSVYEETGSSSRDLLRLAISTLTAMPALDNRFTRSNEWPLCWVLLQAATLMLGDDTKLRTLNQWHGLVLTGSRRNWRSNNLRDSGSSWAKDQQSSLILSCVLLDTVQSLNLHTTCAAYQLLADAPLTPPFTCLRHLLSTSVFGEPGSQWPAQSDSSKAALVMLIVLLNEMLIWARTTTSHNAIFEVDIDRYQACFTEHGASYQRKIDRALEKWHNIYGKTTTAAIMALFHFCKMLSKCPSVLVLPIFADLHTYHTETTSHDKARQAWHRDEKLVGPALEQAWLIFENATETTGGSPIWMPIIIYFAALMVWSGVGSASDNHVPGSIQVLRMFEDELRKIVWPVCDLLCTNLANIRRTRRTLV